MQQNIPAMLLIISAIFFSGTLSSSIVLKPTKTGSSEICLVIIQAGDFLPSQYIPLAEVLQSSLPYTTWVGIPEFTLNISNPLEFSSKYQEVLRKLMSAGMKTKSIYIVAHGLGGIISQLYIASNPSEVKGLILLGKL
jgi:hypothetical protein